MATDQIQRPDDNHDGGDGVGHSGTLSLETYEIVCDHYYLDSLSMDKVSRLVGLPTKVVSLILNELNLVGYLLEWLEHLAFSELELIQKAKLKRISRLIKNAYLLKIEDVRWSDIEVLSPEAIELLDLGDL